MKRPVHHNRYRVLSALRLAVFVGAGVTLTVVYSYAVEQWLESILKYNRLAFAAIAIILVAALAWGLFFWQHDRLQRLVRSEARELDDNDLTARPYLITGLSKLGRTAADWQRMRADIEAALPTIDPRAVGAICDDQDVWARRLAGWQQGLRLLRFLSERGEVKAVYVIDNGAGQIDLFCRLMEHCFPGLKVETIPDGARDGTRPLRLDRNHQPLPDYRSYEYVCAAFDRAFARIMQDHALPRAEAEEQSYIDVTPASRSSRLPRPCRR